MLQDRYSSGVSSSHKSWFDAASSWEVIGSMKSNPLVRLEVERLEGVFVVEEWIGRFLTTAYIHLLRSCAGGVALEGMYPAEIPIAFSLLI